MSDDKRPESPMERALRQKKAAQAARPAPPAAKGRKPEGGPGARSKPWMAR
ncbi:hypothetical protein [Phenylobacterium sp.]|uniref:hypothetical protein n=1 Tax=Phenylobacterium sp. TaxID=1871053 RepID=UPI0019967285|nr:hypothetical protein [Phenylobacterium sp.]MBC7168069.1 hypothetical protein [Phenylobacterium sp.]